jgi:hypothetical protein
MIFRAAAVALMLTTSTAGAQNREHCARVAPHILEMSDLMVLFWREMEALGFAASGRHIGGTAGARLAAIEPLVVNMAPEMRALMQAIDEAAIALRQCARQP